MLTRGGVLGWFGVYTFPTPYSSMEICPLDAHPVTEPRIMNMVCVSVTHLIFHVITHATNLYRQIKAFSAADEGQINYSDFRYCK